MRNFFKPAAIIMAGVLGLSSPNANTTKLSQATQGQKNEAKQDYKANIPAKRRAFSTVKTIGGLDLVHERPGTISMSPKEYGQLFGNGGSKKSNRLRYSHNAKVKRRISAA